MFSAIRSGRRDFGNTMFPRWMCQRSVTWASERPRQGGAHVVGAVGAVVELARDEDLVTVDAGRPHGLADARLVLVHLGRVDVPVAGGERRLDRGRGARGRDLEDAEADLRDVV